MIEIIYHDGTNAIPCPPGQTGGFEKAEYVETAAAIFGSKSRAALMMLGDSAMIVGRK